MAGEKRYLEIRYKDEETGEWTDWSGQKELTDSLSWLNDHAGTSISTIEDFVADKTAINSVLEEGVEDTIRDESHLYKPFATSEMATIKLAVKLAGEDHVSYDSLEELVADEATWDTVLASETAMDAIAGSEPTIDAVASSVTVMSAVFSSGTATTSVGSSESARNTIFEAGSHNYGSEPAYWELELDLSNKSTLSLNVPSDSSDLFGSVNFFVTIDGEEVYRIDEADGTAEVDISSYSGVSVVRFGGDSHENIYDSGGDVYANSWEGDFAVDIGGGGNRNALVTNILLG